MSESVVKEVSVSKEASELIAGLVELVKATKIAVADGFQPGQDLPAIVVAAVQALPAAVEGIDKLGDEIKQDLPGFIKAITLGAADLAGVFIPAASADVQA